MDERGDTVHGADVWRRQETRERTGEERREENEGEQEGEEEEGLLDDAR